LASFSSQERCLGLRTLIFCSGGAVSAAAGAGGAAAAGGVADGAGGGAAGDEPCGVVSSAIRRFPSRVKMRVQDRFTCFCNHLTRSLPLKPSATSVGQPLLAVPVSCLTPLEDSQEWLSYSIPLDAPPNLIRSKPANSPGRDTPHFRGKVHAAASSVRISSDRAAQTAPANQPHRLSRVRPLPAFRPSSSPYGA
jgi:hypothetical protein